MPPYCDHGNHVWTVETRSVHLTPNLDLIPGRRCLCGNAVIIDSDPLNTPGDTLHVVCVDTLEAQVWAAMHPELVTW